MKISARNVLAGTVVKVIKGAVNAEVDLRLDGGESIAAIVTNASADRLRLKEGMKAFAVIKASEVMVATEMEGMKLSARNVLPGVVSSVQDGIVTSEVAIALPRGSTVVASITKASAHNLGLAAGTKASAIIKASNVIIGV